MSVFLKVESFGAATKLFRLRGLCIPVGEDERGILTCQAPSHRFFTLYRSNQCFLLQPACRGLSLNGRSSPPGRQQPFGESAEARVADYRFSFRRIATAWEQLAEMNLGPEQLASITNGGEWGNLSLQYEVGSLARRHPLFPGVEMTVGSAPSAVVYIDLPGIRPRHCRLRRDPSSVWLAPNEGKVYVNGIKIETSCALGVGARITLGETVTLTVLPAAPYTPPRSSRDRPPASHTQTPSSLRLRRQGAPCVR